MLTTLQLAKIEKVRKLKKELYRRKPMKWLEEILNEDPKGLVWSAHEGYENHVWDGSKDPIFAMWQSIADSYAQSQKNKLPEFRKFALESATGTGKTYAVARIVVWFLSMFEDSLVVTTAPSKEQLQIGVWAEISRIYPKLKKHFPNANLYTQRLLMDDKTALKRSSKLDQELDEDFFDGWVASGYVVNPKKGETSTMKARGLHRKYMLIILEEASGMDWATVNAFINTCTGQYNYIFAVGNPNSKQDALHLLCEQEDAKAFRASAYDYPNIVLQKEIYPGAVSQVSINSRKKDYGEGSRLYDAMVRGICPDTSISNLIHADWLHEARTKDIARDHTQNALGVDVAASENGDKGAVAAGKANTLNYVREFTCPNATWLADNILYSSEKLKSLGITDYGIKSLEELYVFPEYIGIDAVGVGTATVESFVNRRYTVQALSGGQWQEVIPIDKYAEKPLWKFQNLRTQMYYELREDFRLGNIRLDIQDEELYKQIVRELTVMEYGLKNGLISVESKESIKKKLGGKSPNVADAIVYWNWARKGYRIVRNEALPISAGV